MFRVVLNVGEGVESTAIKADAWHHRSDAITSAAAFVGICVALWGGPGYETADDWAALLAAAVIIVNGYSILRPALGEILDRAPDTGIEGEVRRLALTVPGVMGTHKCFVRKLGLEFFVDLDLQVDGRMTVETSHQLAHAVQNVIRSELPLITKALIHVEPIRPAPTTG
jgi:cation diffusion facilitator family transporter